MPFEETDSRVELGELAGRHKETTKRADRVAQEMEKRNERMRELLDAGEHPDDACADEKR